MREHPLLDGSVRYVCVGGCGVRGTGYLGFWRFFQLCFARRTHLQGAAGSSSGAMCALALLTNADLGAFMRASRSAVPHGASLFDDVDISRFFTSYGAATGSTLSLLIERILGSMGLSADLTFSRFKEMTGKDFVVCVSNMSSGCPEYLSSATAPDLPLSQALYMSMTIPFLVTPLRHKGTMYVDGGLTNNVPFRVFPPSETFVMHMSEVVSSPVTNWKEFSLAVMQCSLGSQLPSLRDHATQYPSLVADLSHIDTGTLVNIDSSEAENFYCMGAALAAEHFFPGVLELFAILVVHLVRLGM